MYIYYLSIEIYSSIKKNNLKKFEFQSKEDRNTY